MSLGNIIQSNYNYNPSLNIPADKIKPVNCLNSKLYRQSKGKAMVHCISALSDANGRSKQQLRINYLKGIIQKKIHNDKYKHLQSLSLSGNIHQTVTKQTLVPSQYIQAGRIVNNSQNTKTNPFNHQTQNQNNTNIRSSFFNINAPNNNFKVNNSFGHIGSHNNFQNNSYLGNERNFNFNINQSQNYNQTYNQQINQFNKSNKMYDQSNLPTQLPALQRGNTFGAFNPNAASSVPNQQKPAFFQQQNINQQKGGINSFGQNVTNPFNTLQNSLNLNKNAANISQSNFNNPNFTPQNAAETKISNPFNNQSTIGSNNPLIQNQSFTIQNQSTSFPQYQNINSVPNQTVMPNSIQFSSNANTQNTGNINGKQSFQGNFSQQTRQYSMKYPILYKIKQQQLRRFKDSHVNQNVFTIQSLNKHLKDYEQNKFNLWNQVTLNKFEMSPNNQQGRRYITHILKKMIDEKLIDDQILKDSISTLYKFIYGVDVFSHMLNQNKKNANITNNSALLDFVNNQPKNIRLDQILGKSTDQISHSVRGRFKSLQNFDEQIITTNKKIKYNLQDFQNQQGQIFQQQKQKQFFVRIIPQKKIANNTKYCTLQLQKMGQLIKQSRFQTFKTIMVENQQLPIISDFTITPPISQLSKMLKSQIKSVPHVKIQNQWGILQFLTPVSLFKKNINQCVSIRKNQVFIMDQQWQMRQCRVEFKKFADFNEMIQDQKDELKFRIQKWCKDQNIQLIQIKEKQGIVIIKL